MKHIAAAGNTVVPAVLALEALGFSLAAEGTGDDQWIRAVRGEESYVAPDPVTVLGLVKLVELRGWEWSAADDEIGARAPTPGTRAIGERPSNVCCS